MSSVKQSNSKSKAASKKSTRGGAKQPVKQMHTSSIIHDDVLFSSSNMLGNVWELNDTDEVVQCKAPLEDKEIYCRTPYKNTYDFIDTLSHKDDSDIVDEKELE